MARYYDSNIGRFITKDTFHGIEDDPQPLNLYAYTKNNPVMYIDPSGHISIPRFGSFEIIGLGIVTILAGAIVIRGVVISGSSWLYQKVKGFFAKKTAVPSKLKTGGEVKTPETHPGEFTKKSDGSYVHNKTGWKAKIDKSGHRGRHYDMSPPKGKYGDYHNVSPGGKLF